MQSYDNYVQQHWSLPHLREQGAVLIFSHPDDEVLLWALIQWLKKEMVPLYILYLTQGEKGSLFGTNRDEVTPAEVRKTRMEELERAMKFLGATYEALEFPDAELETVERTRLEDAVFARLRRQHPALVASFHPQEVTPNFDHLDHVTAGEVARSAANALDIPGRHPQYSALRARPHLSLWTSDSYKGNVRLPVAGASKAARLAYLSEYYPSQFPAETQLDWQQYFEFADAPNHPLADKLRLALLGRLGSEYHRVVR